MATLGQQLKAAREAKGVSENDAGLATKILTKTILAMESDDFSGMAAPTYAKGFIRLYAAYLGLDPEPLVEEYLSRHASAPPRQSSEKKQAARPFRPARSSSAPDDRTGDPPLKTALNAVAGTFSKAWNRLAQEKPRRSEAPPADAGTPVATGPAKDIRIIAAGVSGLIVLIVLIVSITNCARRRAAEAPAQPTVESPARSLLDGELPDLYLVEPGKIESTR